jgi:PAS domain S-box-containing protein
MRVLLRLKPWHFVALSILGSLFFTSVMSLILQGRVTADYLITGAVVSCIVASVVVSLVSASHKLSAEKGMLEREIEVRKIAEGELNEALVKAEDEKAKTASIIAAMGDGISMQDRDFRIVYQNSIQRGLGGGDHVGRFCYEAYEGNDRVCDGCPVAASFEDGKVHRVERSVEREGGELHVEITASPLRDGSGDIIAGIEVVRDIGNRKTAERERAQLEEQLVHAQKMEALGTLTGGIAHEFNNIMTAIMGFAEYLQDEVREGTDLHQYAAVISMAAERAAKLTDGLLAYSRKQASYMERVDIGEVLRTVEEFLARLVGEDVALAITVSEESLSVTADKSQLEQVLLNLATNAMDAMPHGGRLSIRANKLSVEEEDIISGVAVKPGAYAVLSVADTGSGIPEELTPRIFEPFYTTKDIGKGTGLGLSVVYGIIQKHNGYIFVDSRPGKGTTFSVYLPLSAGPAGHAAQQSRSGASDGPKEPGGTVLVAEDEEDVRKVLRQALEKKGWSVVEAFDGNTAIEQFMRHRDDVILLISDVAMPGKDGIAVYREMKKMNPGLKVLFISGHLEDHRLTEARDEGHAFIKKPFSPKELMSRLEEIL